MLRSLNISTLAKVSGVAVIVGFLSVCIVGVFAVRELKVGGPLYERIVLGKDLVADILPPPEYIIEAFLEANLAVQQPETVEQRAARLQQLQKEYNERHEFWLKQDFDLAVRKTLTEDAHHPAERFWQTVNGNLLPAIRAHDSAGARQALATASKAYAEHRSKIDETVKQAERMTAEVETYAANLERTILLVLLIAAGVVLTIVVAAVAGVLIRIVRPVRDMVATMTKLASGDHAVDVPATNRRDEIGEMARAVLVFQTNSAERLRLEAEQSTDRAAREARAARVDALVKDFDRVTAGIIGAVSFAADQLRSSANTLNATAEEAAKQSTTVSAASEQAASSVGTVAAASAEMASSVQQVTRQVEESARIAAGAAEQAKTTVSQVRELSLGAEKIGEIVDLIGNVAGQTNLLALNATIEAARAGEAGRGFAVVAAEVKSLADQTAKASGQISAQIAAIQTATATAAGAISDVASTIERMNAIAASIARAVEEQAATTQAIAHNVQQASAGTTEVTTNIAGVARAAEETSAASGHVLRASGELASQAELLKREVGRFLDGVRVA